MACLGQNQIFLLSVHFICSRLTIPGGRKPQMAAGSMNTSREISNLAINGVIKLTILARLQCYKWG